MLSGLEAYSWIVMMMAFVFLLPSKNGTIREMVCLGVMWSSVGLLALVQVYVVGASLLWTVICFANIYVPEPIHESDFYIGPFDLSKLPKARFTAEGGFSFN